MFLHNYLSWTTPNIGWVSPVFHNYYLKLYWKVKTEGTMQTSNSRRHWDVILTTAKYQNSKSVILNRGCIRIKLLSLRIWKRPNTVFEVLIFLPPKWLLFILYSTNCVPVVFYWIIHCNLCFIMFEKQLPISVTITTSRCNNAKISMFLKPKNIEIIKD